MTFKILSVSEAKALLQKSEVQLVDIRDQEAYQAGHIEGAQHLADHNYDTFIGSADMDKPVLICCYAGMKSQGVAQHLCDTGFCEVYSLDGGFAAWQGQES
jgi:thiosulfate sulfurtransferase